MTLLIVEIPAKFSDLDDGAYFVKPDDSYSTCWKKLSGDTIIAVNHAASDTMRDPNAEVIWLKSVEV